MAPAPVRFPTAKSISPYWDARVVEAIQKSHFKPGKLDDQAVSIDMNLVVSLMR